MCEYATNQKAFCFFGAVQLKYRSVEVLVSDDAVDVDVGVHRVDAGVHVAEACVHVVHAGVHVVQAGLHVVQAGLHAAVLLR